MENNIISQDELISFLESKKLGYELQVECLLKRLVREGKSIEKGLENREITVMNDCYVFVYDNSITDIQNEIKKIHYKIIEIEDIIKDVKYSLDKIVYNDTYSNYKCGKS